MSESIKTGSLGKPNINEKVHLSSPTQIRPRKSLIVYQKNPIILSPAHKSANPEIVRPNFMNQVSNNMNEKDFSSPTSLKGYSSEPDIGFLKRSSHYSLQKPLEPLSPIMQKKNRSKKIRASCSVDTSWSPNSNNNNFKNNEIRKSRFSYHSDDNESINNNILFEPSYAPASDDQASPLCNFDANI